MGIVLRYDWIVWYSSIIWLNSGYSPIIWLYSGFSPITWLYSGYSPIIWLYSRYSPIIPRRGAKRTEGVPWIGITHTKHNQAWWCAWVPVWGCHASVTYTVIRLNSGYCPMIRLNSVLFSDNMTEWRVFSNNMTEYWVISHKKKDKEKEIQLMTINIRSPPGSLRKYF